jgi:nitronate monooxygenase
MSLWAGQGLRLAQDHTAAEIVKQTVEQAYLLTKSMGNLGKRD